MNLVKEIVDVAVREASGFEAYSFLKIITSYHRVQISEGLYKASKVLVEKVKDSALEIDDINLYLVPSSEAPEWLPVPPYWAIEDAWVEVGERRLSFSEHPTLVVAHSPPTDGIIELEAVKVERWWDPKEYRRAKGKLMVTDGNRTIVYKLAVENDVAALAFFRKDIPETAVPYIGLFLDYNEIMKNPIPSVSLPYKLVREINGKEVRIYIDSELKPNPEIPVVCARIGEGKGTGPLIVSHICHPSPGANDNASGSASNLEALMTIPKIVKALKLKEVEHTMRFLWVPEYTGTVVAIEKLLKGKVSQVVNLDMVGVEPGGNDGPLHLHLSSLSAPGAVEPVTYLSLLRAAERLNFNLYVVDPYSGGSDHDVFIAYGVPSIMIIQWPDTRYHTDEDDVNRISKRMLKLASVVAASTAVALSSEEIEEKVFKEFRSFILRDLYLRRLSQGDREGARIVGSVVAEHYGLRKFDRKPRGVKTAELRPKKEVPIILGVRHVAERNLDKAIELARMLKGLRGLSVYSIYIMEPTFLFDGERSLTDVYSLLRGVYGDVVSLEKLSSITKIYCDVKLLSC